MDNNTITMDINLAMHFYNILKSNCWCKSLEHSKQFLEYYQMYDIIFKTFIP